MIFLFQGKMIFRFHVSFLWEECDKSHFPRSCAGFQVVVPPFSVLYWMTMTVYRWPARDLRRLEGWEEKVGKRDVRIDFAVALAFFPCVAESFFNFKSRSSQTMKWSMYHLRDRCLRTLKNKSWT